MTTSISKSMSTPTSYSKFEPAFESKSSLLSAGAAPPSMQLLLVKVRPEM